MASTTEEQGNATLGCPAPTQGSLGTGDLFSPLALSTTGNPSPHTSHPLHLNPLPQTSPRGVLPTFLDVKGQEWVPTFPSYPIQTHLAVRRQHWDEEFPLPCPPHKLPAPGGSGTAQGQQKGFVHSKPLEDFPGECLTLSKLWHQNIPQSNLDLGSSRTEIQTFPGAAGESRDQTMDQLCPKSLQPGSSQRPKQGRDLSRASSPSTNPFGSSNPLFASGWPLLPIQNQQNPVKRSLEKLPGEEKREEMGREGGKLTL